MVFYLDTKENVEIKVLFHLNISFWIDYFSALEKYIEGPELNVFSASGPRHSE